MSSGLRVSTAPTIEPLTLGEARTFLRVDARSGNLHPNASGAAVDKGSGKVGIPCTDHGLLTNEWMSFENFANYDGDYQVNSASSTNEIVIVATYAAETFTGNETIYGPSDDDNYIINLIKAARLWCETYQRRAYIEQSLTWTLDEFPSDYFLVPRPPLISVTSIKYYDTNGVQQTLSASVYSVDNETQPGRITLAFGQSWPAIRPIANAVEVIYKAGYGTTRASVPEKVRQAMRLLIGHWYEHRESVSEVNLSIVPQAVESLLWQDRICK